MEDRSPEWVFSRDLLKEAITSGGKAGYGDILFYDHGDALSMLLKSPEGTGLAIFNRTVIKEFVDDIFSAVDDDSLTLTDDELQEWLDGLV